jgi:Ca-activated chloride channel family protein
VRKLWDHLIPWALVIAIGVPLGLWVRGRLDEARNGEAIVWQHPSAWWLALGAGLVAWMLFHLRRQRGAALAFTRVSTLGRVRRGAVARLASLPSVLRVLAIVALAGALARPQTFRIITRTVDSIDVMVVMDMSKSMEESDMDPRDDRMDAEQYVVRQFVSQREGDRVGVAIFAEGAMLQCPLTSDMKFLDRVVADLKIGDVPESGTAIGDGLGMALGQLRKSDAKSKVVVLLSDGDNNVVTAFTPEESAAMARSMGVRVFTVLLGAESTDLWGGMSVNPETMQMIADTTGGQFFRATDSEGLNRGFAKVRETLDKDRRVVKERVPDQELFGPLVGLGALLLVLEQILAATRFRRFP